MKDHGAGIKEGDKQDVLKHGSRIRQLAGTVWGEFVGHRRTQLYWKQSRQKHIRACKRSRLIVQSEVLSHCGAAGRQDWRALTEGVWEVRKIPPLALHKALASSTCSSPSSQIPNSFPEQWWARTSNHMLINCSTSGYTKASFLLPAGQGKNLERILGCHSSLLQGYKKLQWK